MEKVVAKSPLPSKIPKPEDAPPPEPVATTAAVESAGDPLELEKARQQYLGILLSHIEEHKFYPRAARRRGLQGIIQVSFLLHQDGRISDLVVADGHAVLQTAAKEAVEAALPLPTPPAEVHCPLNVSYGMEFKLD